MKNDMFAAKGGWWVVAQFVLAGIALIVDVVFRDTIRPSKAISIILDILAILCSLAGVFLAFGGLLKLGSNLTPFPRPIDNGQLVQTGVYGIVRHPIYSGVIIGLFGMALIFGSWVGLLCAVVILLFFDAKSRREEKWLVDKYPEYPAYRTHVRKLIPYIY